MNTHLYCVWCVKLFHYTISLFEEGSQFGDKLSMTWVREGPRQRVEHLIFLFSGGQGKFHYKRAMLNAHKVH